MGKQLGEQRCRWCGRRFVQTPGPGRPRAYCRPGCRQRDFEARQRAHDVGLSDQELVLTRRELDELRDRLWVLQCAIEDVDRDLPGARTVRDYQEALAWLLEAARPVVETAP